MVRIIFSENHYLDSVSSGGKQGVVFAGGSFRKGVRVPIGVPGRGVWGQGGGGEFSCEKRGEGGRRVGRVGGGVGTGKRTVKSTRTRLSKLPFSNLPCSFSPILRGPNWGLFFVLKFVRSRGFWGEISSTVSKVLSDRKGLFKKRGR